jgi:hypothetical protein
MSNRLGACIVALTIGLGGRVLLAQDGPGTLVVDVKPFTSEVELKEKVETQLKAGGLEWGAAEGQVVIPLVPKKFINFDLPYLTRYGQKRSVELQPGTYRLTCVGFVPEGGLSVEKVLKKGAYFNLDLLTFEVEAGKTTVIEVQPTIHKKSTFFVKFFIPELLVRLIQDGVVKAERVINERTEQSIPWEQYKGPLKF